MLQEQNNYFHLQTMGVVLKIVKRFSSPTKQKDEILLYPIKAPDAKCNYGAIIHKINFNVQ